VTAAHIGIILHDFSTGGSERIAIRLGNSWAAQGRQVSLFCGTQDGALRGIVSAGVNVIECLPVTRRSVFSRLHLGRRMARDIRVNQPDIIFAPGNYHIPVLALLARIRFFNRPLFICKLSNPVRGQGAVSWLTRLGEAAMRIAVGPIDAFTAMSPALREQALPVFSGHDIFHLDEPILGDDAMPPSQVAPDSRTIICVGRLAPQKDFSLALAAFAQVDETLDARLLILGEGPLRAELEAQAASLGIADRVEFRGYVPDIGPALATARLYLMTSRFEGYPAVLIEALAAGLPVVTTDCSPAIREIISEEVHGAVCPSRNPHDIANVIEATLCAPMPDRSRLVASTERHRMATVSHAYLSLFDSLVSRARSGSPVRT
jgi:glycosyltransferase involved in cell wall biosynthesis